MVDIFNGITADKIKSCAKTCLIFDDLDEVKNYIETKSYVVAYLYNEVLFGRYDNGFSFPENRKIESRFVKRLRIFNADEELHIWRSKGILKGRHRIDNKGIGTDIIEADQVLFGTKAETCDGYTILTEQRGTKILIPGDWKADAKKIRTAIRTRHYIDYKYGYQATYVDARFVKFIQLPKGRGK